MLEILLHLTVAIVLVSLFSFQKMLHLDVTGNKKRKRCGRVFRFKNFGEPGYPIKFTGAFRENVKALLEFANLEGASCKGMPLWSFQLEVHRHPLFHILLFVVEESIEASLNLHCKHCEYVGWGHHLICNRRYHFLLPSKDTLASCLSCEGRYEYDSTACSVNNNKSNIMELKGHIMHGVFHSNGFGHLLCVNGLEMGSDLAGHQIMQFWDRLCTSLRARNVSLSDFSMKRGMELRLLHGIAYGQPWFGRWGYKFKRGSYGITYSMYQKAIEAIKGMPLSLFIHHTATSNHDIPLIISRYQSLSDKTLATLGDLFLLMFELKSQLPQGNNVDSYDLGELLESNCRWSPKRVEMASRVIVEALKRAEFRWVSRQEVRDTARAYIGDTGLLDFVLKSLSNHIVGNYLVRRSLNPVTKVLEYCLEDVSNVFPGHDCFIMNSNPESHVHYKLTRVQLMKDLFFLYKYILKDRKQQEGIISAIQVAARIVLDTKLLVKDYIGELPFQVELGLEGRLSLYCTVKLRGDGDLNKALMQPYECIPLKTNATINDLKLEIERNFSEIYWGLRGFVVESIVNLNGKSSDLVFGLIEVGRKLVVEGSTRHDKEACMIGDIYEVNPNNKIVDCTCGTKDDDGERMVSCDICEVLQHTRCVRIPNDEEAPFIFICKRCEQEIIWLPSLA